MRSKPGKPAAATARPALRLPVWKKILFGLIISGLFVLLIEGALALVGIKPIQYESDPYVGFSQRYPLFAPELNERGETIMVTAPNKRRIFNPQTFPAKKPKNTFRIFCMGGSTTYGHPYTDSTSFSGWLRTMLPQVDPARQWEVINCGGISYASYREALLMEELKDYDPDLFIILSGHNEFLEQRTYTGLVRMPEFVRDADAMLGKTRVYAAMKAGIDKVKGHRTPGTTVLAPEVEAILDHSVGPQAYHRDEAWRNNVIEHFRFNIGRMVKIARAAEAGVILVTPAVNLRACSPFKSEHRSGIKPEEVANWRKLVNEATQQTRTDNWAEAVAILQKAVQLDPQFADGYYLLGHACWEAKRFEEARTAFWKALAEDVCPLRALPEIIAAVRDAAGKAELVDFAKLLEEKSPHAIPGDEWFLDHVHPTIEAHRILALALIDKMSERGWVARSPQWTEARQMEIKKQVESSLSGQEHGTALCTLAKVIAWAGKNTDAYRIALRARSLSPNDPAIQFEVGKTAKAIGRRDEAIAALKKTLTLQPDFIEAKCLLGSLLVDAGEANEALRLGREAVELRPNDPQVLVVVAGLFTRAGQVEEAVAFCQTALKQSPEYPEAHLALAVALRAQGKWTESLQHFRETVRLRPGLTAAMTGLAWLLATHPEEKFRDPSQAVTLAQRVLELTGYSHWMGYDTLAAAYAALGRFPEATQTQQKALELAGSSSPADVPAVQARLGLYRNGKPYREGGK